jgi:hypothetical protein
MRLSVRSLVGAGAAFLAVFALVAVAWGETCTLELKRLNAVSREADSVFRSVNPQHFFVQLSKGSMQPGDPDQIATFKKIVTKEPKYRLQDPFRGVVRLGSQEFAFALDGTLPAPKDQKADAEKDKQTEARKPDEKKADKSDEKSAKDAANAKLVGKLAKVVTPEKPGVIVYDRLYFDLNHNGDLTDDKVIEAESQGGQRIGGNARQAYSVIRFPRVDVTLDNDGVKSDYSFFFQGQVIAAPNFSYASLLLTAGAYRVGEITLDGKKHQVVLLDFNSNGRFGDETKLLTVSGIQNGKTVSQRYPQQGDMLVIDPALERSRSRDVAGSDNRHDVSKLIDIDGKFYDMKFSPAGDKLTLKPSATPLGMVSNPNGAFHAVICGDYGILKIHGDKDKPAAVPEGEWRLLSYTIQCMDADKSGKAGEKKTDKKADAKKTDAKLSPAMESLSKNLDALLGGSSGGRSRISTVSARLTDECKPVKVVKGRTVEMPFGPPYKPVVTMWGMKDGQQKIASLGMSLVGSAGEVCSNMTINGGSPPKPKFTITDTKGNVVQEGSFEYG